MEAAKEQRVEAVERALSILSAFSDGSKSLTLAELSARTGFYRSTILRLAASLERFGYLHRDSTGMFRLGPTLLRLGVLYQNTFNLSDYVRPILLDLVDKTGETAAFYVREGETRVCLYRQHGPRLIRHHVEEGAVLPLDRGASARILTAFAEGRSDLDAKIREAGVYVSIGERDPETAAIAAPVFGQAHALVGALGITGPRNRFDKDSCERIAAVVKEGAQRLSKTLGHR